MITSVQILGARKGKNMAEHAISIAVIPGDGVGHDVLPVATDVKSVQRQMPAG
jgi:isocitrate dehydrogenase